MTVLVLQLAALLLAAAAIGLLVGWQLQRQSAATRLADLNAQANRVCREERERAEAAIAATETAAQKIGNIKVDYKQASRRLRNLTGALSDSESTIAGLEADVAALQEKLDSTHASHQSELQQIRSIADSQQDESASVNPEFAAMRTRLEAASINEEQLRDELSAAQMRELELNEKYRVLAARADSDDLKRIKGIGPVLEKSLQKHGITQFSQIAALTAEDIETISISLQTFPDRIRRDRWVEQAELLMSES